MPVMEPLLLFNAFKWYLLLRNKGKSSLLITAFEKLSDSRADREK